MRRRRLTHYACVPMGKIAYVRLRPASLLYATELSPEKMVRLRPLVAVAVPTPLCSAGAPVLQSLSVRAAAHTLTVTPPTFFAS